VERIVGRPLTFRCGAPVKLAGLGALAVLTIGCGGGGGAQPAVPSVPAGPAACVTGTVASYIGTTCSQGNTVYNWLSYSCTSTPSSICFSLGSNGSNIQIALDPQGPYTLLVGRTAAWRVTAGQSVDVVISGTVYGARSNGNWPHFKGFPGQTGDGTEESTTRVNCATSAGCLDAHQGVSDILCSATSPVANCTEQPTIAPYTRYRANFNAAPSTAPYGLSIEVKLNGNSGTASLYSLGTHLIPLH